MRYAGILAGGIGSRMGSSIPKQFLKIGGIPAIIRTTRTFLDCPDVDRIVMAIHADWQDYFIDLLEKADINRDRILLTTGGDSRFLSMGKLVDRALADRGADLTDGDLMLVHDCARVFVSKTIIADNFALVNKFDMVTTSMPTIDTVILSEPDGVTEASVPERSCVFLDQGPQTFRLCQYRDLRAQITPEQESSYIEAGRMFRDFGLKVGIVKGDRLNFKLTTSFDIDMAEFLISRGIV